jgi:hypothetical protein
MMRFVKRLIVMSLLALAACGGESAEGWEEGRPLITEMVYLQQSPRDPYQLMFAIAFLDSDGDLSGGKLHLLIEGDIVQTTQMSEVFTKQVPALPATTTEGELEVTVTLDKSTVVEGDRVELGFQLIDAAGEESNQPSVVLEALAPGG